MKEMQKNNGKEYWRSLDQIADTPEFRSFLEREFPENASEMTNPVTRRNFLGLMGASIAFAGLVSCRKPVQKIVPYVKAPEDMIPGIPKYYASTATLGSHAYGVLVESHGGRPTKIEGNEKHPSSLGKTNAFLQAEVLNVYDPDRAKSVSNEGTDAQWSDFVAFWKEKHSQFTESRGEGLAVISGEFSSPTLHRLYETFKSVFPKASWVIDEPVSYKNVYQGLETATGKRVRAKHHFDKAKVVLSIDNDFLGLEQESITGNKGFAKGRKVETEKDEMNRLYIVESSFSVTGSMSDHRKRLSQNQIERFVRQIASALGVLTNASENVVDPAWVNALVKDLKKNPGKSIVVAGHRQTAATHSIVFAINESLSNNGNTVTYHSDPYLVHDGDSIADVIKNASKLDTVIVLGSNPVYNSTAGQNFGEAYKKIKNRITLSLYKDETAALSTWHIHQAHFLESWGDAVAVDGTISTIQPLIQPLYNGKTNTEVLNLITSAEDKDCHDILNETWQDILKTKTLAKNWRRILHDGVHAENKSLITVKADGQAINNLVKSSDISATSLSKDNLEIVFYPSAKTYDGRYVNNGWLQEAPDPVTKISWDNAALISPKTAEELGVKTRDLVFINVGGKELEIVAHVLPGQADYVVSLEVGMGRKDYGRIADGAGFNVNTLKPSDSFSVTGARITPTGRTYVLANTQDHSSMENRPLIREATLEEYKKDPEFAPNMVKHPPLKSLWEEYPYTEGYQWGMAIDLNTCSGCNACVIACQSENNVPIVGKEQVEKGREMHWMRMDRYFSGDLDNPEMVYQPVACQHCENAPCEQVCPVQATLHDKEGLNVMTYNRCVGTRYCSNNCPYKVRRFNFFNYTKDYPETIKMVQNPDVTVRFRGVMEKCTYCTQRIQAAKIGAKNEGRTLVDGEVVTACQQACPADAIVFGNINDPESKVTKVKQQNRNYAMLGELNVKPRTTYLAKLRNPNPEIVKQTETVS